MNQSERYVDGFLLSIKKDRLEDYIKIATLACSIWKEHGALDYVETVGDDLEHPDAPMKSFIETAKTKPDELVVFAWITYSSKESRDEINKKVMADERMKNMPYDAESIFDCKEMSYGGFRIIVKMDTK